MDQGVKQGFRFRVRAVFLHCSKHFFRFLSCFFRLLGGTAMLGFGWVDTWQCFCSLDLNRWPSLTADLVVQWSSHFFQAVDLVPFRLESTLLGMVCKKLLYSSGQNPGPIGMVGLAKLLRFFEPLKPWKPLKSTSKIVGEYETLILFQSLTSIFNYLEKSLIFRWTATALHSSVRLSLEEGFYTERHLAPLVRCLRVSTKPQAVGCFITTAPTYQCCSNPRIGVLGATLVALGKRSVNADAFT